MVPFTFYEYVVPDNLRSGSGESQIHTLHISWETLDFHSIQ